MTWSAITSLHGWAVKRKGLIAGLVGAVVETACASVPGVSLASRLIGELTRHGTDRLLNPAVEVPDVKPAGQAFPTEQLDQINAWLEQLTGCYMSVLDRLETLVPVNGNEPIEQLTLAVQKALCQNDDLARQVSAHAQQVT